MMIMAMPKSASTSVMTTLGRLHDINARQESRLAGDIPKTFATLSALHSDMRELTSELMDRFTADNVIRKQHLLPTDNNLSLIQGRPIVILLREPEEVVLAYRRGI